MNNSQDNITVDTLVSLLQEGFDVGRPIESNRDVYSRGRASVLAVKGMGIAEARTDLFVEAVKQFTDDLMPLLR